MFFVRVEARGGKSMHTFLLFLPGGKRSGELPLTVPYRSVFNCIINILAGNTVVVYLCKGPLVAVTDFLHFMSGLLGSEQEPGEQI